MARSAAMEASLRVRRERYDLEALRKKILGSADAEVAERLMRVIGSHHGVHKALIDRVTLRSLPKKFSPLCFLLPSFSGSIVGLHAQCASFGKFDVGPSFDGEWSTDGNKCERFSVRAFPYVAQVHRYRKQVIRIMDDVADGLGTVTGSPPRATVWDIVAILRFCRRSLPNPCTIITRHSYFRGTYDMRDPTFGPKYAAFDIRGSRVRVFGAHENDFISPPCIVLSYVDTTVDLLA